MSLVKRQHERRLRREIYSQWVLRVYGIAVSMEDKAWRDGEIRLGRQVEARSRRAL